jgi:hypothetical protein
VLSAHVRREDLAWLSAKEPLPAGRRRVASAESFLSAEALPRGKQPLPRGLGLSAEASNPVVVGGIWVGKTTLGNKILVFS